MPALIAASCRQSGPVCDVHNADIENRPAVFRVHLAPDVVNPPNRAVLAHNPILHTVNGILGIVDLLGNVQLNAVNVRRVYHGLNDPPTCL